MRPLKDTTVSRKTGTEPQRKGLKSFSPFPYLKRMEGMEIRFPDYFKDVDSPIWHVSSDATLLYQQDRLHYRVTIEGDFPSIITQSLCTLIREDLLAYFQARQVPGIITERVRISDSRNNFLRDDYFWLEAPPISYENWAQMDLSGIKAWKDGVSILFVSALLKDELLEEFKDLKFYPDYRCFG